MKPKAEFLNQPPAFWGLVRYISQKLGYSDRSSGLKRYDVKEIKSLGERFYLDKKIIKDVREYLKFRAEVLEKHVKVQLMDRTEAKKLFKTITSKHKPSCYLPYNKQKGKKRHLNYLTCILNVLTELQFGGQFDDNPRELCYVTDKNNQIIKVFSRWMDGVYPATRNPIAVWETKEYYGTTTFGSRVADGIYETQLDGYEIKECERIIGHKIEHYLIIDDRFTWWTKGKSYLCRLIDLMHMHFVDEVIFGKEVLERWPKIITKWSSKNYQVNKSLS